MAGVGPAMEGEGNAAGARIAPGRPDLFMSEDIGFISRQLAICSQQPGAADHVVAGDVLRSNAAQQGLHRATYRGGTGRNHRENHV